MYDGDIASTLVTEEAIQERIAELAAQIAADRAGSDSDLLLVGVLKGAVMFMTDLARALPVPVQLEFMAVSSYGSATSSSGVVRILKDLDRDIAGRDVLIVEDIIDSGLTLSWLMKNLETRQRGQCREGGHREPGRGSGVERLGAERERDVADVAVRAGVVQGVAQVDHAVAGRQRREVQR